MSGPSTKSRDPKQWAQLLKLLGDIDKQKPLNDDSEESRAKALQNIMRDDKFILYLCKGDGENFKADMLQTLDPDNISVEFKRSEIEHGERMINFRMCEQISRTIMESEINAKALKLIDDLEDDPGPKDDPTDDSNEDGMDGIDMYGKEAQDLQMLIRSLPEKVVLIPESLREIQKPMFATINKFYLSHPPKPISYTPTYSVITLQAVATETKRTEFEVRSEWDRYSTWWKELEKEYAETQETITKKIYEAEENLADKTLWHGQVPLLEMGDMWSRLKSQDLAQKAFGELMEQRWLQFQFPKGWSSLPPTDDGSFPSAEELQRAVDARVKAQKQLNALKGKGAATDSLSTGSPSDSHGQSMPSTSDSNGVSMPRVSAPDQAQMKYEPSATATSAVPDYSQLAQLISLLNISGAGAFPGNQGQPSIGNSNKPPKYSLQLQSLRSKQIEIAKPNTTKNGERIMAWFERTRTMKDDEDEMKTATQKDTYFVVRKMREDRTLIHEVMSSEYCGAERALKMLQKDVVPQLWDTKNVKELPSSKKIGKVNWGIEWAAAKDKINIRPGSRDIPNLILCVWWLVSPDDVRGEKEPERFQKGVTSGDPLERHVILNRGGLHSLVGKVRGDLQICESVPHPRGEAWGSVEDIIRHYTTEKVLAPPARQVVNNK